MKTFERVATGVRRGLPLPTDHPVWRTLRPLYRKFLVTAGKRGLVRTMNGTDPFLILPEMYNLLETYEPDVWRVLMSEIRPGDVVADVGASIGLYTLAIARRVGPHGRVYAFEPDPSSADILHRLLDLNDLSERVEVVQKVVGAGPGRVEFVAGGGSESHVRPNGARISRPTISVDVVTLDEMFANQKLDLVKIDVEGFEESVLVGAETILCDRTRAPRSLFVEVHPFAWGAFGTTDRSLLSRLERNNYSVFDLAGTPVEAMTEYGEVVARRHEPVSSNK
jgi:FkbM family methyltransferase